MKTRWTVRLVRGHSFVDHLYHEYAAFMKESYASKRGAERGYDKSANKVNRIRRSNGVQTYIPPFVEAIPAVKQ